MGAVKKTKETATLKLVQNASAPDGEMQTLVRNFLLTRTQFLQRLMDDPRKDINKECGYPDMPTVQTYRTWYDREGIATRVVTVYPDECWCVYPELYENEGVRRTPFELAWQDLLDEPELCPWHYLHRADCLSGIGAFGVLLLGIDDGKDLSEPVDGIDQYGRPDPDNRQERKLLYLRVFDQILVQIAKTNTDKNSPRYGKPELYNLRMSDPGLTTGTFTGAGGIDYTLTEVHWSRIIHFADNRMSSEVYGIPRMQPVLNRLYDLRKTLAGAGEMFWRGALPGWAFETPPELGTDVERDDDALRDQVEAWQNGMQKYIALTGMRARSLAPQVVAPTAHVEEQLRAICTTIKTPMRIFQGSEAGHLASTQDAETWNKRLQQRQLTYVNPQVIRPFVQRLMLIGVLPIAKKFNTHWNDLNAMSDEMKANVALKKSQALFQYVTGKCESVVPFREYCVLILGMTPDAADALVQALNEQKKMFTKKTWDNQQPGGPQGGGRVGNAGGDPGRPQSGPK